MCMRCIAPAIINSNYMDCTCGDQTSARVVEKVVSSTDSNTGAVTFESVKTCESCVTGAFQGPFNRPVYECAKCPIEGQYYVNKVDEQGHWICQCDTQNWEATNGICLPKTDVTTSLATYPT